jgi:hypothetical protein
VASSVADGTQRRHDGDQCSGKKRCASPQKNGARVPKRGVADGRKAPACRVHITNHPPLLYHSSQKSQWRATVVTCANINREAKNVKCDTIARWDHRKKPRIFAFPLPSRQKMPTLIQGAGSRGESRALPIVGSCAHVPRPPGCRAAGRTVEFHQLRGAGMGFEEVAQSCSEVTHRVLLHNERRRPKTGR